MGRAPQQRGTRPWRLAVGLVLVPLIVMTYVRLGWSRMEQVCLADPPGETRDTRSVELGWSWTAPGFSCTYADGRTETSLWFSSRA